MRGMRKHLARLFLTVSVSVGLLASTAAAAGAGASLEQATAIRGPQAQQATLQGGCPTKVSIGAPLRAQESAMLCLIGETRTRHGLPPLAPSESLQESAIEKGRDLIRCNEFSHTACGREFSFWIHESGYMEPECWRVGENLAWGVEDQATVGSIFRAWMRSPTHRDNILGDFEETGIDLRVGRLGGLTGVHVWTQHFGSHC
jgi:uncharacterized protein YkwD